MLLNEKFDVFAMSLAGNTGLFPCPKIVGFWPASFARVNSSQALCGLISAKSWALLAASQ